MKLPELQTTLKQQKIDLLLLTHPDPNINYLTQVQPSFSIFKITENKATILLSKLDDLTPSEGIQIKEYKKTYKDDIKEELNETTEPRIAINKSQLTVKEFESLQKEFPSAIWVDFSKELQELRLTKTEAELKIMFKAAKIADEALASFVQSYKENKQIFQTELDIALFLEKKIREQGATLSFPTIVATKPNSAIPHHVTSTDKLRPGLLLIDMGAQYQGYASDMTRMFSIGKPSKEEQADFDILDKVQRACIKEAQKNAQNRNFQLQDLNEFAKDQLKDNAEFFIHSLGHGIGVEVHEAPRIAKGETQTIQMNLPFTIEPGIYFPNKWGLRIEDTVIWAGEKMVRLTKSPKELIIL